METLISLKEILTSDLFYLTLTVAVYICVVKLQKSFPAFSILFHPVLFSALLIIGIISILDIDYKDYFRGNETINFMLGFSVVTVGYIMHKNFNRIKSYKYTILISTFIGSVVGVVSIVWLSKIIGCDEVVMRSLQPKSVTTAIALSLSTNIGGIPALTIVGVVVAGIFGSAIGPLLFKIFHITDPVAKGLALGSASHAVGTAKAIEIGALEGAVGGVAIGLMGLFTSIIVPIINEM